MRTALVAAAAATALVACGGDDPRPGASPSGSPLTKQAFVEAANGVCQDFLEASKEIGSNDDNTVEEYVAGVRKGLAAAETARSRLRALVPPRADAAAVEANLAYYFDVMVTSLRDAMPAIEEAARKGDRDAAHAAAFVAISKADSVTRGANPFLQEYGLTDCL